MAQALPQLTSHEEDEIIKKRLLTRLSVTTGTAPLRRVQQRFVQFVAGLDAKSGVADAEFERRYQYLLRELVFYEYPLQKAFAIIDANLREQESYNRKKEELEASIKQAEASIAELKVVLEKERVERAHKEECEGIRKQIAAEPSRADSQRALAELDEDIKSLEEECAAADDTLELRKQQFARLLQALDELQGLIEGDKAENGDGGQDTGPEPMNVDQPKT